MSKAKRTYKDGVFRQLFNDKEKLIELYNALSGKDYGKDTEIEIVTLEDALFGDIKNDLSFIMDEIALIRRKSTRKLINCIYPSKIFSISRSSLSCPWRFSADTGTITSSSLRSKACRMVFRHLDIWFLETLSAFVATISPSRP